jgi:hypothetical protein
VPTKPPGATAAAAAGVVAAEVVVAVGGDVEERVTIWNRTTQRRVSGTAAPQVRKIYHTPSWPRSWANFSLF